MEHNILGLHHITAIASDAQRNFNFYTKVLGLRLVKKTVNFDDPGTYHFYYGNEVGAPGTILTFFPWGGIGQGKPGTGMATGIGYAVPHNAFPFWKKRFKQFGVAFEESEKWGEPVLSFMDPDGLQLNLVAPKTEDARQPWATADVKKEAAIKGFHNVVLTLRNIDATAKVLTDILGYTLQGNEGNNYRFATDAIDTANIIDITSAPNSRPGHGAAGTTHHIAFRVKDEATLMHYREKVVAAGHNITPKIDRNYFYSLYFREPGGVLFEIATDNPGFATDEPVAELGTHLMLPAQYEPHRKEIENVLPLLK